MKILHIDSSITGEASVSRRLSAEVVSRLKELHSDAEVIYRDACSPEVPHHTAELMAYKIGLAKGEVQEDSVNPKIRDANAITNSILEEFLAADVLVVGVPMYNLSIPSQLKSWIDSISVPGKTFRYTESGAQGLCHGKKVILASVRGGIYSSPESVSFDHEEKYLISLFNFFGIENIQVLRAEGVNISPELHQKEMDKALGEIKELALAD